MTSLGETQRDDAESVADITLQSLSLLANAWDGYVPRRSHLSRMCVWDAF